MTDKARRALALALTDMIRDDAITRSHAVTLARMVLRENAVALYGLGAHTRETSSNPEPPRH